MFTQFCYNMVMFYTYICFYLKKLYVLLNIGAGEKDGGIMIYQDCVESWRSVHHLPSVKLRGVGDFVIHTDKNDKQIIYFGHPFKLYETPACTYKFISTVATVDGKKYTILDDGRFFMVGNRINKYIVKYLLKDLKIDTYSLDIIDQNANFITLGENDEIVLNLNTYEIKNNIKKIE